MFISVKSSSASEPKKGTLSKSPDLFTLHIMIEMLSSHTKSIKGTLYGLAKRCMKPSLFFWTIFILDFGTKLYRQIVGIAMGTNCAVKLLNYSIQCLYIWIYNTYFDGMVNQTYPSELQLNKANLYDTEAPFWIYN